VTRHSAAYLTAASSALSLLTEPAVTATWSLPSALPELTVGGLAAHLAYQVSSVPTILAAPPATDTPLVSLREYYERAAWRGAAPDTEINRGIRASADELASQGPEAVAAAVAAAIEQLSDALPGAPDDRPVPSRALRLDDFLVTRMMEIAVHSDDLAVSADLPTPELPFDVLEPVLSLLIGLSVGRHGQAAVIRALARVERAPATINAL